LWLLVLAALAAGLLAAPAVMAAGSGGTAYINGRIFTADKAKPMAQAVVVRNGRIAYVGPTMGAGRFIGKHTKVVNLHQRLVLPGFVDSHTHTGMTGTMLFSVQLYGMKSVDEYTAAVAAFAAANPTFPAIKGSGWSNTVVPDGGPLASSLDAVVSDKPVSIMSEDGHSYWVNSKALQLAGITGTTPDPVGGKIERLPDSVDAGNPYGIPSGTLRETAADLVNSKLPDYTVDQYKQGILYYQDQIAGPLGITSVFDPLLKIGSNTIKAYEELAQAGLLTIRVRGALSLTPQDDLGTWIPQAIAERAKHATPMFQTNAVKFFADGVIEGHTGYLKKPYKDALAYAGDASYRGTPIWTPVEMTAAFKAVDKAGFQIHVHSIGDAATTEVLNALAATRKDDGARDWRPGITHLQLVDPTDYKRFARLGVTAVPDPYWYLMDDYYWTLQLPYLGKYRADHEYPMKIFFTAGALVASASDFPVTIPPDPIIGIQTGVMRWAAGWGIPRKNVLWPEQKVGVRQMIDSFTINGAKADFTDKVTGSLKKGKSADLIVLSKDLLTVPNVKMDTAHVVLTVFHGKVVYRAK
jgi:predicted amidohydrolase YtcJ